MEYVSLSYIVVSYTKKLFCCTNQVEPRPTHLFCSCQHQTQKPKPHLSVLGHFYYFFFFSPNYLTYSAFAFLWSQLGMIFKIFSSCLPHGHQPIRGDADFSTVRFQETQQLCWWLTVQLPGKKKGRQMGPGAGISRYQASLYQLIGEHLGISTTCMATGRMSTWFQHKTEIGWSTSLPVFNTCLLLVLTSVIPSFPSVISNFRLVNCTPFHVSGWNNSSDDPLPHVQLRGFANQSLIGGKFF